jgi:hypothetical protein
MIELTSLNLDNILPSAILVSTIGFLAWFFGNAISDQRPFSDDKKWQVYISGTFFLVNASMSFLVAMFLVSRWKYLKVLDIGESFRITNQYLFLLFVVSAIILVFLSKKTVDFYDIKIDKKKKLEEVVKDGKVWKKIGFSAVFDFFRTLVFVLLILLYQRGGGLSFFYGVGLAFLILFAMAVIQSLDRHNFLEANIYFNDKLKKPIKKCRILKINDDNVRIRKGDKVILFNKNSIFKIETIIKNIKNAEK